MKRLLLAMAMLVNGVFAQEWQAEFMVGGASYNGDLAEKALNLRRVRPTVSLNIKYEFYYLVFRAGFTYSHLVGHDKYNKDPYLRNRNLSFRSNVWEFNAIAEYNLVEPDIFHAYPYLFAGVGLLHSDPYAFDNEGNKVKLRPLRTEGQGLPQYPGRKPYSKIQACIPVGAGWKWKLNEKFDLAYELGFRILFTDYLDDVSTTYANPAFLNSEVGPKSVEMANRAKPVPGSNYLPKTGDMRGNPDVNDNYFMSSFKIIWHLQGRKD